MFLGRNNSNICCKIKTINLKQVVHGLFYKDKKIKSINKCINHLIKNNLFAKCYTKQKHMTEITEIYRYNIL